MERRIRVCYVINRFMVGGAETVALDVARSIDPRRFEVVVLATLEPRHGAGSEMQRRFTLAGVRQVCLGIKSFKDPRALARLWWFLARERFDIVHGHSRFSDAWAVAVGRWAGIPHRFWTRHLVYTDMNAAQIARYRRLSRHVDLVIAVSDTVRRACIETEGVAPEKVETVVNGIDTERYRPRSAEECAKTRVALEVGADEQMLLFVGRMDPQKAPEAFVRLVWRLRAAGRPVRGFLCGRGPLDQQIKDLIAGGPGGVQLLGVRGDIPELLAAADLFVSTSRNEGLPLNVMEAMSAATCFIAPDIGQIRELAHASDLLAPLLFAPPPAGAVPETLIDDWAAVAQRYLDDPELRRRVGEAGRRVIVESFSLDRMVRKHEQIYERFLARRRRG